MLKESLQKIRIGDTSHGKGVFAVEPILNGTIITEVKGEHLTFEDTTKAVADESFCVQISMKDYVLPNPPFYLINHSCNPNSGLNHKLELVALRDIQTNEEIVWDYSTTMLERHWVMKCSCGSETCRGSVTDFDTLPAGLQKKYIDLGIVQPFILQYLSDIEKR